MKKLFLLLSMAALILNFSGSAQAGDLLDLGQAADFAILGLNTGSVIINSATSIEGNVGYSDGLTSTTNQKVDSFIGAAYVHSGAIFSYTAATYQPSAGILTGATVDSKLNQANTDALNASSLAAGLTPTLTLGTVTTNQTINSTGYLNIISIDSLNFNSNSLQLNSRPGFNDSFVFNIADGFSFSQSDIILSGTTANHVLFNFPNASTIDINKATSIFYGTILAPTSDITYHNPAYYEGAIIGLNLNLHSDFNMVQNGFDPVITPEPVSATLFLLGGGFMAFKRFRSIMG